MLSRGEWSDVIGREAGSKRHDTLARDEGGVEGRRLMFMCVQWVQEVVILLYIPVLSCRSLSSGSYSGCLYIMGDRRTNVEKAAQI